MEILVSIIVLIGMMVTTLKRDKQIRTELKQIRAEIKLLKNKA